MIPNSTYKMFLWKNKKKPSCIFWILPWLGAMYITLHITPIWHVHISLACCSHDPRTRHCSIATHCTEWSHWTLRLWSLALTLKISWHTSCLLLQWIVLFLKVTILKICEAQPQTCRALLWYACKPFYTDFFYNMNNTVAYPGILRAMALFLWDRGHCIAKSYCSR